MTPKQEIIAIIGYAFAIGHSIVMTITFAVAYLNNYRTIVTINEYGEANIEIIAITVTWIFMLLGIYYLCKADKRKLNKTTTNQKDEIEIWSVNDLE